MSETKQTHGYVQNKEALEKLGREVSVRVEQWLDQGMRCVFARLVFEHCQQLLDIVPHPPVRSGRGQEVGHRQTFVNKAAHASAGLGER